jgi:hypothetical protein
MESRFSTRSGVAEHIKRTTLFSESILCEERRFLEDITMTETKILGIAATLMLGVSLLFAGLLFWLNAGPLVVVFGGTLAGIGAYITLFLLSKSYITEVSTEEEDYA